MLKLPEKPKPPAFRPSRTMCFIAAMSSVLGLILGSRAASLPITYARTGEYGTNDAALTPSRPRSRLSRYSGNVTQSQRIPAFIHDHGIDSVRSIRNIARSRSSGFTGAKPKPQFPIATVVTPCHPDSEAYGSHLVPPLSAAS